MYVSNRKLTLIHRCAQREVGVVSALSLVLKRRRVDSFVALFAQRTVCLCLSQHERESGRQGTCFQPCFMTRAEVQGGWVAGGAERGQGCPVTLTPAASESLGSSNVNKGWEAFS